MELEEEIILFWKSPELANQSTSNTEDIKDKEYESPLPSLSLHLRRNSEEKGYFGAFASYQSLSAGDFQAELDRKFLGRILISQAWNFEINKISIFLITFQPLVTARSPLQVR